MRKVHDRGALRHVNRRSLMRDERRRGHSDPVRSENPDRPWQVNALLRGDDGSIWVGGSQGLLRTKISSWEPC